MVGTSLRTVRPARCCIKFFDSRDEKPKKCIFFLAWHRWTIHLLCLLKIHQCSIYRHVPTCSIWDRGLSQILAVSIKILNIDSSFGNWPWSFDSSLAMADVGESQQQLCLLPVDPPSFKLRSAREAPTSGVAPMSGPKFPDDWEKKLENLEHRTPRAKLFSSILEWAIAWPQSTFVEPNLLFAFFFAPEHPLISP